MPIKAAGGNLAKMAYEKSGEAIQTANHTQTQLDQVLGASTIDPAVEQMKVGSDGATVYNSPDERIRTEYNAIIQQLENKVEVADFEERNDSVDQVLTKHEREISSITHRLSGIKFEDLQEPLYIAHRGAKNIFPEESTEAYRGCVNMGLNVIEMDIRVTTDGTLICHHDETMERTTNKTGQVKYYSAMGFKNAVIDELPGWNGTPTLFEDLLREFGNKVIYVPEIKDYEDSTAKKLTDMIIAHNLQDNVLIQSFSAPNLVYPLQKGLPVCYLRNNTDISPTDILSWGFGNVGLSSSLPDSYVRSCINAGLKVYMYTINRRYQHDHYLSMGVHGFFTDDPLWIMRESPILEWDPFRDQVFAHGQISPPAISGNVGGYRGGFVTPNKFGWTGESNASDFSLQGWAGELAHNFTFQGRINFVKTVSSVRWASVALCTPIDYWDDYENALCGGYHILLRENGTLDVYKRVIGQAATLLRSLTTTPITQGQTAELKVQVTNTSLLITRVDTGHTMTINDATYRGGYLHFGRRYLGATFENVQVKRQ